jgi:hypothetical protein
LATAFATEQAYVQNLYRGILQRSASDVASPTTLADISHWVNAIVQGVLTESNVETALTSSAEVSSYVMPIVELYQGL